MQLKQESLKPKSRFDLEQEILDVWGTAEDLQAIYEHFYDHHESMTVDEMANLLLGLKQLVHIKCQKLFSTFEELVKNGRLSNDGL